MGQLYARVAGVWVPISQSNPIAVQPDDPGVNTGYQLWYDTDAPGYTVPTGIPVGGAANQALLKIDGTNYNTKWQTMPLGVVKKIENAGGGNVSCPASTLTYLHNPLVYTFVSGRQYKLCWTMRAVARNDNSDSPLMTNLGLYDGTTATGWVDHWHGFRQQWSHITGAWLFTDNAARSLRLGINPPGVALTIYTTQVWIEDMGAIPT